MARSDIKWRFSLAIMLPVLGAVVLTLAIGATFVVWSAAGTDERALARETGLVARMIEASREDLEGAQGGFALWYQAVDAIAAAGGVDHEWIDTYFGYQEFTDYGHDLIFLLDPELNPVYAARQGEEVETAEYSGTRQIIDPLAVRFRAPAFVAETEAYQAGKAEWPAHVTDLVSIGGRPAFISILPIVTDWEGYEQPSGKWYLHVAIRLLDADVAQNLMDDYLIRDAHFDAIASVLPGEAAYPIADAAGRFAAWFKWTPERPGAALLREAIPAAIGVVVIVLGIVVLLLIGLARSTAALDKARQEALFRATHDPLTGLGNRALFAERLRSAPLPLTLLALDLDRFKAVNDTLGHEAGDDLLKQVAARLTPLVRAADLVARLGGDEFMILLSGSMNAEELRALAARIVAALGAPFQLGAHTAKIGVSIGIATASSDERDDLVSRADFALYDAKEAGRNTYRMFETIQRAA
ncbi:MAG: diguanylate cyclase [Devosia sp.]